jgi:type I site-specific restriction endonuclease
MPTPEDLAREHIDQALEQAGWRVQDYKSANLQAGRGVALRNFPLMSGHGFEDYLLYVDGKAAGIIEAKKEGRNKGVRNHFLNGRSRAEVHEWTDRREPCPEV